MKKLICLFSISLFFFVSCSNDAEILKEDPIAVDPIAVKDPIPVKDPVTAGDPPVNSPDPNLTLPTEQIILDFEKKPISLKFIFNGNKILRKMTESGTLQIFTYTGDLITKIQNFGSDGILEVTLEYFYTDGELSKYTRRVEAAGYPTYDKYIYTHHSDGTVSYVIFRISNSTGAEEIISTNIFTIKNGNIIKSQSTSSGGTYVTTYEYDSKNSPMKNVLGFNKIFEELPQVSSSLNNIISYTTTIPTKSGGTYTYTNEIKYVYGANDFAAKIKFSQDFGMNYSY